MLDPKCTLTHSKNMCMKEHKIAWFIKSESLKALRFLSFHRVQNKYNRAALHTFFLFFPTKDPCQIRRTSLIMKDITHWTSKRAKIRCHNKVTFGQWSRIWLANSSSPLYKKHLLGRRQPLLYSWSKVRIFSKLLPKQKSWLSLRPKGSTQYLQGSLSERALIGRS